MSDALNTLKNGAMPMPVCIMGCIMVDRLNRYIFIPEHKVKKEAMVMVCILSISTHITVSKINNSLEY